MFWSKDGHFLKLFFLINVRLENVFYDILERKNAFLGYKNKKFKKWKNWHFSKVVNPWFWCKKSHFFKLFFLGNIGQENVFYNNLERKNAFLGYKTRSSKSRKIDIFPKGLVHCFCPKMAIFQPFLLRQYRQGKCLLRYSRTKNDFLSYKNKKFKKWKNWHFSKRVNP